MDTEQQITPAAGSLLISDPFLRDPNFSRTVVFLCAHNEDGTVGFVLNRPYEQHLGELVPSLEGFDIPLYYGGPVEQQTLHLIHAIESLGTDETRIGNGMWWGTDFEMIVDMIRNHLIEIEHIRFFMGYSGWSPGQLGNEMTDKSWLVAQGSPSLVFKTDPVDIWRDAILSLDQQYHPLVNYPTDPQLN